MKGQKKNQNPEIEHRICRDCVHMYACQLWNIGRMENTVADQCSVYEKPKETAAYYLGLYDGKREQKQ